MASDTRERAKTAYIELTKDGLKPTVERIRDRIGGGGTDLINAVIREMKVQLVVFAEMPLIPNEIQASMAELWTNAVSAARKGLDQELAALTADHVAAQTSLVTSQNYAAELEGRLTAADQAHQVLQEQLAQSRQARGALEAELDALRQEHAGLQALFDERSGALDAERATVAQLREQEVILRRERMDAETTHLEALSALQIQQHEALSALRASHQTNQDAVHVRHQQMLDEKQSIIHEQGVQLAQQAAKLEDAGREIEQLTASGQNIEARVRELSGDLAKALATVDVIRENEAALRGELHERSATIERVTTENLTLKARLGRRVSKTPK